MAQLPNARDAHQYLNEVKVQFQSDPEVYHQFLDLLQEHRSQLIDTNRIISCVSTLFAGYPNLLAGFNIFLPPNIEIPTFNTNAIDKLMLRIADLHSSDLGIETDCGLIERKCDFIDSISPCTSRDEIAEPQYYIDRLDDIIFMRLYLRCKSNKTECGECHAKDSDLMCESCNMVAYCCDKCRQAHIRAHSLDCKKLSRQLHPVIHKFIYMLIDRFLI